MLRRLLIALSVGAVFAVIGGVAWATIPSKDGTINACYSNRLGLVRIVDPDIGKCLRGETPITWNQTGPQGPAGTFSITSAWSTPATVAAGRTGFAWAVCPAGATAISPSVIIEDSSNSQLVQAESFPFGTGDHRSGWEVSMRNLGSASSTFTVSTYCLFNTVYGTP